MNFSESKKISQCIFTTLIKVLKFVKKKLYLGPLHMSRLTGLARLPG